MAVAALALGSTTAFADTPPEVPVAFSGTLAAGETQTVQFTVPWLDKYAATVYPADAPVTLTLNRPYPNPPIPNFQGGVLIPMTTYSLDIHASAATDYEVDIDEVPPTLTDVSGGPAYVGPNDAYTAQYTLNVPAFVEPVITNWAGGDAMVIPVEYMTSPGAETLKWDLRDPDGKRVPDGQYHVALTARTTSESLPVPAGDVIVDSTPPHINLKLESPNNTHTRVLADVLDPGPHPASMSNRFGIAKVTASADGGPPEDMGMTGPYPTESGRYSVRGGVWTPGKHTVTVQATDLLGNSGSASISFIVPSPTRAHGPDCSSLAVKTAVRSSKPLNRTLRRLARAPHGDLFHHFAIGQRACSDLTRDGTSELMVLLREQHGQRTVAAIFKQAAGNWSLAYADARHRIDAIAVTVFDMRETLRARAGRKPRQIRIYWDGSRFVPAAVSS